MTLLATHKQPMPRFPGLNDRVSVPDGSVGRVLGFYTRIPETVLVLFDSGASREYLPADLHRLG
jgi:hypothetical protein